MKPLDQMTPEERASYKIGFDRFFKKLLEQMIKKQEYYEELIYPDFLAGTLSDEELEDWDEQIRLHFSRDDIFEKYKKDQLTAQEYAAWEDYIDEEEEELEEMEREDAFDRA